MAASPYAYDPSHPDTRSAPQSTGSIYGNSLINLITQTANKYGVDPRAVLAVAPHEGGFDGAVGDGGTSFGPWQLHAGGALPASIWSQGYDYAKRWANSPAGIEYAIKGIASAIGNARGPQAAAKIVTNFERPAAQYVAGEAQRAMETYGASSIPGGYSQPAQSPSTPQGNQSPQSVNPMTQAAAQAPTQAPPSGVGSVNIPMPTSVPLPPAFHLNPSSALALHALIGRIGS